MKINIELPEAMGQKLQEKWNNLPRKTLEALAIQAYRDGIMTEAEIQTLLNFSSRWETDEFLKLSQVYPDHKSDFGEFIQKFRQEHNLEQEGIEPEELLEGVRDLSSGGAVIW